MAYEVTNDGTGIVNGLLKQKYSKRLGSSLNKNTPIFNEFQNSREEYSGNSVKVGVELRRGGATQPIPEGGTLPTPVTAVDKQAEFFSKTLTTTDSFSAEVLAASKSPDSAFVAKLEGRLKRMENNLRDDINRQMFGNYVSGKGTAILATVPTGGTGVTSLVLSDVSRIRVGFRIAFGVATATVFTPSAYTVVTGVTRSTSTITCTACSPNTGDLVVKGESGAVSYNCDVLGIDYICQPASASDSYGGLSQADYPEWSANVRANGGNARDLSVELMQGVVDDCLNESGTEPDFIVCHTTQRAKYGQLLLQDARYAALQLHGGQGDNLTFSGGAKPIKLTVDQWAPQNKIYFLSKPSIQWFVREDFKWMDSTGSVLRSVGRSLVTEATYHTMRELGCIQRNCNGALIDLATT